MKLVPIFDDPKPTLYAIKFEGQDKDEFYRLLTLWKDREYLFSFFKQHEGDLSFGFFKETISNAIKNTIRQVEYIEDEIWRCCMEGHDDKSESLQTLFQALDDSETSLYPLQKSKAKSRYSRRSYIRIYALRIAENLFVITGGAIKLTKRMEERPHTKLELVKIQKVKAFLEKMNLIDPDDFEVVEL